ncbi:Casein kinase I-like isoform gamma-1 [Leptotrombidium deliense]|uniref:non-specific serine/threonine protein kinase n=1 Tax=Leptotrombidium deliense TaxID=299467 RepID=A0A443S5B5_9ACAR|nr:Casein kinase I-like isoform gamma-1 [Leptotrombidium deliense]
MDLGPNMPLVGPNYLVGQRLGRGNFGEIRLGTDMWTNKPVAIKFEPARGRSVSLDLEYDYYKRIGLVEGFPKIHYFGRSGRFNVLVMDLLGPNLDQLFEACNQKFSLKTVCEIAIQTITRIEQVHNKYLIYRDMKPDNFLLGANSDNVHIIHLVDFGLSKEYMNPTTGEHISYRESQTMTGTVRYMSCNTHAGKETSRRDDLEALGYIFVFFLQGKLPWQGVMGSNTTERYKMVSEMKANTTLETLCKGLPSEFIKFLTYSRKLDFFERPDYDYLKNMFVNLMKKLGFTRDFEYDWSMKLKNGEINISNDSKSTNSNTGTGK